MRRRRYLALAGAVTLAGCLDSNTDDADPEDTDNSAPDNPSQSETPNADSGSGSGSEDDQERADEERLSFERTWDVEFGTTTINAVNYAAAVSADTLFAGNDAGLIAVDRASGAVRWSRESPQEYKRIHAVGETVVALTQEAEVLVLNTADGSMRWRYAIVARSTTEATVAVNDGYVYTGGEEELIAHDRTSGERAWRREFTPDAVFATADRVVASPRTGGVTYGYDPTGTRQWETRITLSASGSLDGETYVGPAFAEDGQVLAGVDVRTGDVTWVTAEESVPLFKPVNAADGLAVLTRNAQTDDGRVTQLQAYNADGTLAWERTLGDVLVPFQPPALGSDLVVAQTPNGVGAFGRETGEQLATTTEPALTMVGLLDDSQFFNCSAPLVAYDLTADA